MSWRADTIEWPADITIKSSLVSLTSKTRCSRTNDGLLSAYSKTNGPLIITEWKLTQRDWPWNHHLIAQTIVTRPWSRSKRRELDGQVQLAFHQTSRHCRLSNSKICQSRKSLWAEGLTVSCFLSCAMPRQKSSRKWRVCAISSTYKTSSQLSTKPQITSIQEKRRHNIREPNRCTHRIFIKTRSRN